MDFVRYCISMVALGTFGFISLVGTIWAVYFVCYYIWPFLLLGMFAWALYSLGEFILDLW